MQILRCYCIKGAGILLISHDCKYEDGAAESEFKKGLSDIVWDIQMGTVLDRGRAVVHEIKLAPEVIALRWWRC